MFLTKRFLLTPFIFKATNYYIGSDRIYDFGFWDAVSKCPTGKFAVGFQLTSQASCGSCDDTALNRLKLSCEDGSIIQSPASSVPIPGTQRANLTCATGSYLVGFRFRQERMQGTSDDTSGNNIDMLCSNGKTLSGNGESWGDWQTWRNCTAGDGIIGLQTQIDNDGADKTGIANVNFACGKR
jgi:hypothetical protein